MSRRGKDIHLNSLHAGMPGITPQFGAALAEAATVCFEDQRHVSGVQMNVDGDFADDVAVHWLTLADPRQAQKCWGDPEAATEHGAYGVAALLISEFTELTVVERSRKGTGFDYWLGKKGDSQPLFQNKARLEVSGIRVGTASDIASRTQKKLRQTSLSDGKLPALVTVVEFGTPRSRVVKKS